MADCNCGHDHDGGTLPPYDVDKALKEMARARLRRDPVTRAQARIGDQLASYLTGQFSAEELETAGRAILAGASGVAALIEEQMPPVILVNVLGFAGARMVTDGRAWEPVDAGTTS